MKYSFKTSSYREDSNALKYDLREQLFATNDVEPLWVADMDIDMPDFILDSLRDRLKHPIFGYEEVPNSLYKSQINWIKKEHNLDFKVENILYSPSVIASINMAIKAFTKEGDKVIVQTPVYPPFFQTVLNQNRILVKNQLKKDSFGKYKFDIDDLLSKIDKDTKLLLLCSPHNPVGRVWKRDELEQILDICLKNNIIVFSDEIHSDLVYKPNKHIPFSSLNDKAKEITITAMGVGKTFNMAGFSISTVLIQDKKLRDKFKHIYTKTHFGNGTILSCVAFETAYRDGKEWLEQLKVHLKSNFLMLENICEKYPKLIKLTPIEATYLAWLDCNGMRLTNKKLRRFFIEEAKLGLSSGLSFGREGSGFMRLNFAVSSDRMLKIVKQLDIALDRFRKVDG